MRSGLTFLLAVITLLTDACAAQSVRIESRALAQTTAPSERLIIAAVDNDGAALAARAGGTPRGYDTLAPYGPTPGARERLHAVETQYGLTEVNAWPIDPLHLHCAVLEVPAGQTPASVLAALAQDPRIRLAQPLQTFETRSGEYNDPYVGLQRGFSALDVAAAHALSTGRGVRVALIDTGADTEHPDLAASIAAAQNFVDGDAVQFKRDRHGTEIAGVIAAVANNHRGIVGIAPEARLLLFKACWQVAPGADAARCNSFTLARALVAALDAHAQVVNLSLAGPKDPLLSGLIREGLRRGVLFVGAVTGEESGARGLLEPDGVIGVASLENPSGEGAAVRAPGREILTLLPGDRYDFASGDSIATAEITGIVALLLARQPGLSPTAALAALKTASLTGVSASEGGAPEEPDACAAVRAVMGGGGGACSDGGGSRLVRKRD